MQWSWQHWQKEKRHEIFTSKWVRFSFSIFNGIKSSLSYPNEGYNVHTIIIISVETSYSTSYVHFVENAMKLFKIKDEWKWNYLITFEFYSPVTDAAVSAAFTSPHSCCVTWHLIARSNLIYTGKIFFASNVIGTWEYVWGGCACTCRVKKF